MLKSTLNEVVIRMDDYLEFFLQRENLTVLIWSLCLLLVWIGSGAFAASIAERRLRHRGRHFLGGLFMPLLYPAGILLFLRPPKAISRGPMSEVNSDILQMKGASPVGTRSPAPQAKIRQPQTQVEPAPDYNQAFFKKMCFDEAGAVRGPFGFRVESVTLRVEQIVEAKPETVVIETINAGGQLQTLRIPYHKIEWCREL